MKKAFKNVLVNNWTVTIVATMVGVFAGIYLNELNQQRKLNHSTAQAIKKIREEVEGNRKVVAHGHALLTRFKEPMHTLFSLLNEEQELILSPEQMKHFRQDFDGAFLIHDSVPVGNGRFRYVGEVAVDLGALPVQLSRIAWDTFRHTQLASEVPFDCLYQLELLYKFQNEMGEAHQQWLTAMGVKAHNETQLKELFTKWEILLSYEASLLKLYEATGANLLQCG